MLIERKEDMGNLFETDPWHLFIGKWDESKSSDYKKALSLSNSIIKIDGGFEEDGSKTKLQNVWMSRPSPNTDGYQGIQSSFMDLKQIKILFNGKKLDWQNDHIEDLTIDLNLHNGLLTRSFTVNRSDVSVQIKFERFLSIEDPEPLVERVQLFNRGFKAFSVEIHASLDAGDLSNSDWEMLDLKTQQASGSITMIMKPNQFGTPRFMAGAMSHHLTELRSVANSDFYSTKVENRFRGELGSNQSVFFEKRVVVATSLKYSSDREINEQLFNQSNELDNFSFDDLLEQNTRSWQKRYEKTDIQIDGDPNLQQIVRIANFRFLEVKEPLLPLSWMDESLVVPAWLDAGLSESAKKLLNMRFGHLPALVNNAKKIGGYGAFLPFLTFDGNENFNDQTATLYGVHRTCALVFAISQYLKFTDDQEWLDNTGRQLLVEATNFLHQRTQYSEYRKQYVVLGVCGPDEYQFNVNNNWLTNYLIKWSLNYALTTIPDEFDEELSKELRNIINNIYLPVVNVDGRLIKLEEDEFLQKDLSFTTEKLTIFDRPVSEKWTQDRIARSPIANQPDVFWAFYYFPQNFTVREIEDNFDFYQKYLAHETDISRGMTALVAALAGKIEKAHELMIEDQKKFTAIDSKKAALIRSIIIRGFLGMKIVDGNLVLNPKITDRLISYKLLISYKDCLVNVKVEVDHCEISLERGSEISIKIGNQVKTVSKGHLTSFDLLRVSK